jgi:hypothetical protein
MPDLVLGVIEVSYSDAGKKTPRKRRHNKKGRSTGDSEPKDGGPVTTVMVARILEEKYGVMQAFYNDTQDNILGEVIHSLEGALEDIYSGSPVKDPYAEATQNIDAGFRQWLMQGEIESMGISGVPTQASIERRSLRFKEGVASGPRPSFVDTSLYELSFRSTIE